MLDAIHYLCLTKSAFGNSDLQHIKHGEQFFMTQGQFFRDNHNYLIDCNVQQNKGKIFRNNKKEYERMSLHIGEFPCILMMPYDTDLIREGSEIRRKFFDNMISQCNPLYLQALMQYNQLLKQRNSTLQYFAEKNTYDKDLLESYNVPLLALNEKIFAERQHFSTLFVPLLQEYYQQISTNKEDATLFYESDLQGKSPINLPTNSEQTDFKMEFETDWKTDFKALFYNNLQKDLSTQRTTVGVHKDDYNFQLRNLSVAKYGSQGQQKSYVIALRMAQNKLIANAKNNKPILLLDDIFDKLDENRMLQLLNYIDSENCGQVFITDARPERTQKLVEKLNKTVKIIEL